MRTRDISELVSLMQPAAVELVGDDAEVGPDVVIDNRRVTPGAVFVAIPGERVDGHDFAEAAVAAGATGIIATHLTSADAPHILAADSIDALSWLARGLVAEARSRGMLSIGVTGSSGKTSTKDLMAQIFERAGSTVAPVGSQNNEIGVPLTACRVDDSTDFLISEMGARGIGHIAWLTSLVALDIGVVLNIGTAHMGEFGGKEVTARAKSEIIADVGPEGWAVLNADDPLVASMAETTKAKVAWFAVDCEPTGELTLCARDIEVNALSQASFTMVANRDGVVTTATVQLGVIGLHQVSNALAAAATALAAGLALEDIADALNAATPRSQWRMELLHSPSGATILNDSYNANPDSMAAALRTAANLRSGAGTDHPDARLIGVLGDMLELGDDADQFHREVGELAASLGFDEVIAVGIYAEHVVAGATSGNVSARALDRDEIASSLTLGAGDVVVVKGSRGVGLETVAAAMAARDGETS